MRTKTIACVFANALLGGTLVETSPSHVRAESLPRHSATPVQYAGADQPAWSSERVARLMAEVPKVPELALSPDGQWVVYTVASGSVADNNYNTQLLLQRAATQDIITDASPVVIARTTSDSPGSFRPRWRPDAEAFSCFDGSSGEGRHLVQYVIGGGRTPVAVRGMPQAGGDQRAAASVQVGSDYQWSRSGALIAFTAPLRDTNAIDPRRGLVASLNWRPGATNRSALFVLDVASGSVKQLSPDTMHIHQFDWSPDESALVVSATPDAEGNPVYRTDLFRIDRATAAVRPLVAQPGIDAGPRWSPDGKWIVFSSRFGERTNNGGWTAVVAADGGPIKQVGTKNDPLFPVSYSAFWTADSKSVYFLSSSRMSRRLFRADIATRSVAHLSRGDDITESSFSSSRDGQEVAFIRELSTEPPQVFKQRLPDGAPMQLTRTGNSFPLTSLVRVDEVSWPSRDRKFTIHGLLLTPRTAWANNSGPDAGRPVAALPTLVFLTGGPAMVVREFAPGEDNGTGPLLPMATLGYAVLVPNTRGRGGFGEAFRRGMRDGPSAGRLPYEDMMAGVDALIERRIADPNRLGIYGHSYGGYLASYAVTQTTRFKAAMIHEAHVVEWLTGGLAAAAHGTDWALLHRDLYGIQNPYDARERERLIAESPGLNGDRVTTPTLLQFGARANADRVGRPFFSALRRFGVPSEFMVFDEGHGFVRPAAVATSHEVTADWFEFWIRNQQDSSAAKRNQYERWQALRAVARAAPAKPSI